jgi:membrane-associated protease RseP (regulator of RpoE activity)
VNELDLPASAVVWSVDGEKTVQIPDDGASGKVKTVVSGNPTALRELLKTKIGRTVTIRYSAALNKSPRDVPFTVRSGNVDPWQMRISYFLDQRMFELKTESVNAHGNPIVAVQMSSRYVVNVIRQVYTLLSKIASRRVGTQSVAGPVGIFKMAYQSAELGYAQLMLFLAFISVNLAVINFLPMPVMDGGLMLFLIIEKIKGKPLSLKAQMISTMVGVAAIILIGLAVTIQDIGRFF